MSHLERIDPALGFLKDFGRVTNGLPAIVQKMRQESVFKEGKVPIKYKTLAATLWAISARCEPCIRFYVNEAVKQGATEEEFGEFLAIGATMGGCVGEMWSLKAYKVYKDRQKEATPEGPAACCQT